MRKIVLLIVVILSLVFCNIVIAASPFYAAKGLASGSSLSSVTPSYPLGTASGDIVFLTCISNQPNGIGVIETPTDFIPVSQNTYSNSVPTSQGRAALFWRRANAAHSGYITVTRTGDTGNDSSFLCQMHLFRGAISSGDPWDEIVAKYDGNGSTTATWSAVTVSSTERHLIAIIAQADDQDILGTPTGYIERAEDFDGSGTDAGIELYDRWNQSTDGQVTATTAQVEGWVTYHISLKPNPPPAIHECFSTSSTATNIGNLAYCGNESCGGTEYCYPTGGVTYPNWVETIGSDGIIDGDYSLGQEVLMIGAGANASPTFAYLNYNADVQNVYATVWMRIIGSGSTPQGTLSSGGFRQVFTFAQTDGSAVISVRMLNHATYGYVLDIAWYSGTANHFSTTESTLSFIPVTYSGDGNNPPYNWVDKWVVLKIKYTASTHASGVGWEVTDAYGKRLRSQSYDLADTHRAGSGRYQVGWAYTSTFGNSAVAFFKNLNVNTSGWAVDPFSYGTCGTESTGVQTTDTCANFGCSNTEACTFSCSSSQNVYSGSTYEWPVLTRYASGAYNACGYETDTSQTFPYTGYNVGRTDVILDYNQDSHEITDSSIPSKDQVEGVINYIQQITQPSRTVVISNNTYTDFGVDLTSPYIGYGVDGTGDSEAVQIINGLATGTATTTPAGDYDHGFYTIILPPHFDGDRSSAFGRYPVVLTTLGIGSTVNGDIYTSSNNVLKRFMKLIAESWNGTNSLCTASQLPWSCCTGSGAGNCREGVIGVIGNCGGTYQSGGSPEYIDSIDLMMAELYDHLWADKTKVVMYGGSRGGHSALKVAGEDDGHSNYQVVGILAAAPPAQIGTHSFAEGSTWVKFAGFYPTITGQYSCSGSCDSNEYLTAANTWRYSSPIPPHCSSVNPAVCNKATMAKAWTNSDDKDTADAASPIGYCDTIAHCKQYYGGTCSGSPYADCSTDAQCSALGQGTCTGLKYFVLSQGTHDSTIPLFGFLKFDEKLRDAEIPHKTCMVFRGGHTGEAFDCVEHAAIDLINSYLARNTFPTNANLPNGREYWYSNTTTHNISDLTCYGCENTCTGECVGEASGVNLPFMAIIPAVISSDIDANDMCNSSGVPYACCTDNRAGSCPTGHPYDNKEQPAQFMVAGKENDTWELEILNSSDASFSPPKKWFGTFSSQGDNNHCTAANIPNDCCTGNQTGDCDCDFYGKEFCVFGTTDNVRFGATGTYHYAFKYNGVPTSSYQTTFKNRIGLQDSFYRPDSASLGSDWTEDTSYAEIAGLAARNSNADGFSALAHHNVPVADATRCNGSNACQQWARVRVVNTGSSQCVGVILRSEASSGYRYVVKVKAGTTTAWHTYDWNSDLGEAPNSSLITWADGDYLGTTVTGVGSNTILRVWQLTSNDSTSPYAIDEWNKPYCSISTELFCTIDSECPTGETCTHDTANITLTPPAWYANSGRYMGIFIDGSGSDPFIADEFYGGDFSDGTSRLAVTEVIDHEPNYPEALMRFAGTEVFGLNTGICQLPSCGNKLCESWEDTTSCATGHCSVTTSTVCYTTAQCPGGETCVLEGGDCDQVYYGKGIYRRMTEE